MFLDFETVVRVVLILTSHFTVDLALQFSFALLLLITYNSYGQYIAL